MMLKETLPNPIKFKFSLIKYALLLLLSFELKLFKFFPKKFLVFSKL